MTVHLTCQFAFQGVLLLGGNRAGDGGWGGGGNKGKKSRKKRRPVGESFELDSSRETGGRGHECELNKV